MKYIDAEKLLSEIDRLNSLVSYESEDRHDDGLHDAYKAVKNIVTSLQQEQLQVINASKMEPEVDLEKEIDKAIADYSFTKTIDSGGFKTTVIDYAKIARHFYELGKALNARKEE